MDLKALEDAAKREGRVTFYGSLNPALQAEIVAAFKSRFGIDADAVRLASGPLSQRYASEAEADNVVADVVQLDDPEFFGLATQKNWITSISNLPALAPWPKEFVFGTYAKVAISPWGVAFNTNAVKESEAPKTFQDLLDPRWKDNLLMIDPRSTAAVLALWYFAREQYGDDYLRRLAAQNPRLVPSGVPGGQQLAAGAGHIMAPVVHASLLPLFQEKAPVGDVLIEPSVGQEQQIGVSTKAPHPNAGRLFCNYLLSLEGQAMLVKGGYVSVLPNVPGAQPLPKSYHSPKIREALASQDVLLGLLNIH